MTRITYFGHSAVLITSKSGLQILIDPFISANPLSPKNSTAQLGNIDIIALTHGHADHVGDTIKIAQATGATVCATYELAMLLAKDGIESNQLCFMNKGGTVKVKDVEISLTQAFHSSSYDSVSGDTHYAGEAAGIVVTLEDSTCIYHAGDTLLFSDMELIAKRFSPNVALLPIGDRFTMGPQEAAEAFRLIGAPLVIPIHYATFDLLSGTPEQFLSALGQDAERARVLTPGEWLELD